MHVSRTQPRSISKSANITNMSMKASEKVALLPSGREENPLQPLSSRPPSYGDGYQPLAADPGNSNTTVMMTQPSASSGECTTTYEIRQPPNQLVLALVALCLCTWFWPAISCATLGMIYSVQVDSQWTNKDYEGARKASLYAKRWSIAALVVGGVGFVSISVVVITYEVAGVIAYS